MFINDKPIRKEGDDKLSRKGFSANLAQAIAQWKDEESLVISLFGKWGSGKSSLINLAVTRLKELDIETRPTVIEFNPWLFSGEEGLTRHFFDEIAKELEIVGTSEKDKEKTKELVSRLRVYSKLLGLFPQKTSLESVIQKTLVYLGTLGLTSSQILAFIKIGSATVHTVLFGIGLLLVVTSFLSSYIEKIADYLEEKINLKEKSVRAYKEDIQKALQGRSSKILIVIDDIDRLTPEETRTIFKLIKANTDFPNIIYLLSFDRDVVEKALEEQAGISGKDYLEKIIQVNFDIPLTKQEKLGGILFEELNRALEALPQSAKDLFDSVYWGNIYHAGLKDFFKNIRDIKRFISSLEFYFALMVSEKTIEVNPTDLIAVEAMRVFTPDFYAFMSTHNDLFTSVREQSHSTQTRKAEMEKALELIPENLREPTTQMLRKLFPQVDGVLQYGYSSHRYDWIPRWNRELRVCAPDIFDTYFTLIPGGDESELSQFEVEQTLESVGDEKKFEELLRTFQKKGKLKKVLTRLLDYAPEVDKIPLKDGPNVVRALFNISDEVVDQRVEMFDFGINMDIARVIFQLLKRTGDKKGNAELLRKAIEESTGLFGGVYTVSLESQREEKDKDTELVLEEDLPSLKELCLKKIREYKDVGKLKIDDNFLAILYRWKEWSKEEDWKDYINKIIQDDKGLVEFVGAFVSENMSHTFGDYVSRKKKRVNYDGVDFWIPKGEVKERFESIKEKDEELYKANKETIDIYLDRYNKKDPFDD